MSLRVAIQMDPIHAIDIGGDSTFAMALEAQARGHELWHYLPQAMSYRDGKLTARANRLTVQAVRGDHAAFGPDEVLDLSGLDVILMRQDPPFDMAYITATHFLDHVAGRVLVTNDPTAVRNAPEKLFVTRFPDLMPPTLISSDRAEIMAFRNEHRDIVVKPLFGNGGAGVFHLRPDDENLGSLLETYARLSREPLIVQRYLPEIRRGDKRIILIEGEPVGAVMRLPAEGESRANLHVGGRAEKAPLTARDREICARIGPTLRAEGQLFVGIDIIGDWLTEINVTSPTGIHEINRLDGVKIEALFWDAVEARAAAHPGQRSG